jgi:hypothetical protein
MYRQQKHEPQDLKGGQQDPQNEEVEEQVQKKIIQRTKLIVNDIGE